MKYWSGFISGIILLVCAAELYDGGAQSACMEIFHVKCELKYVPLTESKDGGSK